MPEGEYHSTCSLPTRQNTSPPAMLPVGMVLSVCCLLVMPWADQARIDQGCAGAYAKRVYGRLCLHHLPRKGATSLSCSGREKAKAKLPWEQEMQTFGRSAPGGRHSARRGRNMLQWAARGEIDMLAAAVRLGAPCHPATGGEAHSAGSDVELVTRQG